MIAGEIRFVRVLVAEQDAKLRTALCVWVSHVPGMELAGVARNSRELRLALSTGGADIAIVDWLLLADEADAVPIEAARLDPPPRIIVVGLPTDPVHESALGPVAAVVDKGRLPGALFQVLSKQR